MEENKDFGRFIDDNHLVFQVRQNTPMIHFQSYQEGAFLRATELKPKFDKFLDSKKDKYKDIINDDFILKKNENDQNKSSSFNYKVRIKVKDSDLYKTDIEKENGVDKYNNIKFTSFPQFFGNIGNDKEKEKNDRFRFVYCKKPFEIEFFSYNKKLLEFIKNNFAEFLFQTNFGTRQSKGFGSFYIDGEDLSLTENYKNIHYASFFDVELNKNYDKNNGIYYDNWKKIFDNIDLLYKTFRSGINHNIYFKSLMYHYAAHKNYSWGKKLIKKEFKELSSQSNNKKNVSCITDKDESNTKDILKYKLYRDMLGLSVEQTWNNYKVLKENSVKKEDEKIERFMSPIMFKPILLNDENKNINKCRVYIILNNINEKIFEQKFSISSAKLSKNSTIQIKTKSGKDKIDICTPSPEDFNLNDFFDFCLKFIDEKLKQNEKSKKNDFDLENKECRKIVNIYKDLIKNKWSNF